MKEKHRINIQDLSIIDPKDYKPAMIEQEIKKLRITKANDNLEGDECLKYLDTSLLSIELGARLFSDYENNLEESQNGEFDFLYFYETKSNLSEFQLFCLLYKDNPEDGQIIYCVSTIVHDKSGYRIWNNS